MSENNQAMGGYGFTDDEVPSGSNLFFGLNQGTVKMSKFEWIPNAGKDGAEQEAIDIEFVVEGMERPIRYRKFPITKAYDKDNGNAEVTDPSHPKFKEAQAELNQVITHILGCYLDKDSIKAGFNKPISSFKDFAQAAQNMLPKDFANKPLDAFFQYQWNIPEGKDRTFLELPKNMKQGKFLCAATSNDWKEVRTSKSLKYTDENGNTHPFQRGEWFVNNNFANQQKNNEENEVSHEDNSSTSTAGSW